MGRPAVALTLNPNEKAAKRPPFLLPPPREPGAYPAMTQELSIAQEDCRGRLRFQNLADREDLRPQALAKLGGILSAFWMQDRRLNA